MSDTAEYFDAAAYLAGNPDLLAGFDEYRKQANLPNISNEELASLHYKNHGKSEGRKFLYPNRTVTPANQSQTQTVTPANQSQTSNSTAISQGGIASTSEEQRAQILRNLTPDNFDALAYLQSNPDVAKYIQENLKDFGGDPFRGAAEHYAKFGMAEGRSATAPRPGSVNPGFNFDAAAYLRANPDVAKYVQENLGQFGGDANRGAMEHFLLHGAGEGRQAPTRGTAGGIAGGTTYGSGSGGLATGVVERTPGAIVEPLFSALQNRALDVLETPYTPYSGRQVAQASPLQEQGFAGLAGLAMPSEIMENATRALSETTAAYGRNPYTYEARDITTGLGPVGSVQDYMNPYVQGVVNVQSDEARRQAQIAAQAANAGFASRSAFGGSRQAIENAERERNLAMLLNKVTQEGYSSAYDRAQAQRLAEAGKFQEAQTASEAGRRTVASDTARYGLEALQGAGQSALNEINAQKSIQQLELDRLNAQLGAGATQRSIEQAGLTADYNDFLREQGYQAKQLADVLPTSNVLLGQSNVTNTYGQPPNAAAQIIGGILAGGAGGYNMAPTPAPAPAPAPATTTNTNWP